MSARRSVKLTVTTLRDALRAVLPHAGTDGPSVIQSVHFKGYQDTLTVLATDRYTAGMYRLPTTGDTSGINAMLAPAHCRQLLALFRPGRSSLDRMATVELTFTDVAVAAECRGIRVEYPLIPGTYPLVGKVFSDAIANTTSTEVASIEVASTHLLNARFLRRFEPAMAGSAWSPVHFTTTPLGPVIVRAGDNFIGLVMQMRATSDGLAFDWSAILRDRSPKNTTKNATKETTA